MTKILKMAAAASSLLCGLRTALVRGRVPLPPPHPPQEPTMWSSGEFGCVSRRSTHPCPLQVHRTTWVGKGGTLEPLDPASPHKEKTPGAQLRSCGWQAIFQFLYPSSHPTNHLGTASRPHGPGVGAANPIVAAQAPVEAGLGWAHTIKTSPLRAAGTAQLGRATSRDWGGLRSPFCLQLPLFVNKHSSASSPPPESRFCRREKSCTVSALDVHRNLKLLGDWRRAGGWARLGRGSGL